MPRRSFSHRRGKPRLESQQQNAFITTNKFNRNLPQKKRSQLAQIKRTNDKNNNSISKKEENLSEQELKQRMWKNLEVSAHNPIAAPLVSSKFATRYPEHRESYIRMSFKKIQQFLKKYGINIAVEYQQCSLIVSTTNKTWDPYSIIKARDMIRLIARYVPFEHSLKVMDDNTFSDIIEIGKTNVARNQVRFIKRRSRLIGPNGVTLRAIELLTKCYVLVYGRTVCCIGAMKGIKIVRKIVMDCMNNIHPIYQLKRLMVEQELSSNNELSSESWDRFLPTFKKMKRNNRMNSNNLLKNGKSLTISQIKKITQKKKRRHSGRYTPWPPAPTPSKIDIALENGAYWNKNWRKENLKRLTSEQKFIKNKMQQQKQKLNKQQIFKKKQKTLRRIRKEMRFIPPNENNVNTQNTKNKLKNTHFSDKGNYININAFAQNLGKIKKIKQRKDVNDDVKNFLL